MFFVLSKILAFALVPSNIFIALVIVGALLLYTRFSRFGRLLAAIGSALIILAGLSPIGVILLGVLENRFPAWDETRGAPAGFIILGGALNPDLSAVRHTPVLDGSAERLTIVAELARRFPSARFIFSGGNASLIGGEAEADYVVPLLESFGVAKDRIALERRARNTAENAAFSKVLAAPKSNERWVMVTSGTHMPRAIGAFRAAGFDVEAFPVDWRTGGSPEAFDVNSAFIIGLNAFDSATREFIGLAAYRLTGRSTELFPAPH